MKMRNTLKLLFLISNCVLLSFFNTVSGQIMVSGTVFDGLDANRSISDVSIMIKGSNKGTTSGSDGRYKISVGSLLDTLVFSFVGYKTQEVPLNGKSKMDVILQGDIKQNEEVVVVGYGEQTKESVVGAVSTVSGTKLVESRATGNLMTSLQGSAPGVTVFTTGEKPGQTQVQIQLRAGTSMNNNNPLFIVDNVEVPNINNIDPIDIESVSILKGGGAATAVYGVKAANGVVIIKTKRGKKGSVALNLSNETTVKRPVRLPRFMDGYQTMLLRNEAFKNDGQWDQLISNDVLEHYRLGDAPYLYPDFDWQSYLWKPGMDQSNNLNAVGGNDFVQYFASLSYLREGSIMNTKDFSKAFPYSEDPSYWSNRFNLRSNLDFNLSKSTRFSVQLSGVLQDRNSPVDDYTQELMFQPVNALPYYPQAALDKFPDDLIPYNQTGVRPFIDPSRGSNVRLLWVGGAGVRRYSVNDFDANLVLDQKLDFITQGLSISGLYSYQSSQTFLAQDNLYIPGFYGYFLSPVDSTWTRYDATGNRDLNTPQPKLQIQPTMGLNSAFRAHYYKLQFDYNRRFGDHNVGATGIFSRRQSRGIADFPSYEEDWIVRGTYDYQSKYFLEASAAHTGSEKFAPGLRFGTFPAAGVGWILSKEKFIEKMFPEWINYLKVKYSYGKVGSDAGIPRWLYMSSYQPDAGNVIFGNPSVGYPTIAEGPVAVTNATWETAIKQNLGIDFGFFSNVITLGVNLYKTRRENILMARNSVPTWMGITGDVFANLGKTEAHGIELEAGVNKSITRDFGINFNGNLSVSESKVDFWDESKSMPENLKAEGKPVDIAMRMNYYTPTAGVQTSGFYQSFDDLFMWPLASGGRAPIVGDLRFLDYNGDGVVNSLDQVVAKHPFVPTMNWNADLGFRYKNWSLDLVFYGISQVEYPLRQGGMFFLFPFTQNKDEAMVAHGDHWTPENTNPLFPAVHSFAEDQYNYRISSFSILNGQYISLKRAALGYNLRSSGLSRIGIGQIQLTFTGMNLWMWTRLPFGGDPEGANYGQDFGAYPISQRFSLSANISFNAKNR